MLFQVPQVHISRPAAPGPPIVLYSSWALGTVRDALCQLTRNTTESGAQVFQVKLVWSLKGVYDQRELFK